MQLAWGRSQSVIRSFRYLAVWFLILVLIFYPDLSDQQRFFFHILFSALLYYGGYWEKCSNNTVIFWISPEKWSPTSPWPSDCRGFCTAQLERDRQRGTTEDLGQRDVRTERPWAWWGQAEVRHGLKAQLHGHAGGETMPKRGYRCSHPSSSEKNSQVMWKHPDFIFSS